MLRSHHDHGFTLVEVLIAMLVFTIGLLGVAALTIMIISGNSFSRALTTATALAHDKLEELRDTPYSAISDGKETVAENNLTYTRVWKVTTDQPAAGMTTVEVTISWPALQQRQPVVLRTIIANTP
jgi:type IV pilus assembly protein PilV